jgi:dTDP-L-rhamnose 4-epimerase
MERPEADSMALNIGSGQPISIREIATELGQTLGVTVPVQLPGKYRAGDIRHCFADISRARAVLGYEPKVQFGGGLRELVGWLGSQTAADHVDDAMQQLTTMGLVA